MRDLTKSVTSYTWALSVFGVQQIFNVLGLGGSGSWHRSTKAFNNVTEATSNELGDTMRAVFRSGDTLQRGMVDLFLAPFNFTSGNSGANGTREAGGARGGGRPDGNRGGGWVDAAARVAQAGADAIQATVDTTTRAAKRAADSPPPQNPPQRGSAPQSSDPSLGWGPMPR